MRTHAQDARRGVAVGVVSAARARGKENNALRILPSACSPARIYMGVEYTSGRCAVTRNGCTLAFGRIPIVSRKYRRENESRTRGRHLNLDPRLEFHQGTGRVNRLILSGGVWKK